MNQVNRDLLNQYILTLGKELAAGNATEHTHRPALKTLIEALANGTTATNEPQRIKCGAPDFIITKGAVTIGYVKAKDVGKSLDEAEKSEQLSRYLHSLTNLILTDYLEFRWYVNGEHHLSARLGPATKDGKIKRDKDSIEQVAELERTGQGVLGFITNHSYLDNPTFRGMRQSLINGFTDIYILNLHGNSKKKEVAPDGGKDQGG